MTPDTAPAPVAVNPEGLNPASSPTPPHVGAAAEAAPLPVGRVCAVVAAHLEPVTRFDGRDLHETEPEQSFDVALELTLSQQASFDTDERSGPAGLSVGTDRVNGQAAFQAELQRRLLLARSQAPQAIKAWVDADAGSYRRLMSPGSAFLTSPGAVGFEHTCSNCGGACQVTCGNCGGVGSNNCNGCGGSGKKFCYSCHGNKKVNCGTCGGSGQRTEHVSNQVWNSQSNSWVTVHGTQQGRCHNCSGSGKLPCNACDYQGKIRCDGGCNGTGRINCSPCRTTGRVDCQACRASGIQYVWGTIQAELERSETLGVFSSDEALLALVHDKLPPEDLPALGALLDVQHEISQSGVQTRHRLRLDVRRAGIRALQHDFVIHGFGPEPKVFSLENIAGHLLADDLAALEQKVVAASRWRRAGGSELLDSTADFLRSELNMLIAESVADSKGTPQEAAQQVQAQFHGLVDSAYVERASAAVRAALARLYGAELSAPALYLMALTMLCAGLLSGLGWPASGFWSAGPWSLGAAATAWAVLEWLTRRRIARHFSTVFGLRVVAQLRANGSVRRWRLGMAMGATMAVWLAMTGVQLLPFVRNHQAELRELGQANQLLDQWFAQSSADLRQRSYPSAKLLASRAEAGDGRAQLILAWQLLLGAGGTAKDVAAAGKWLDKGSAPAGKDSLWQAAKAVHVLNQDAKPDAVRGAVADLHQAAERGVVEARFWEAGIYLEERGPAYDLKRGLQTLTQAADQRHARAALVLGERFAKGQGVRRDAAAARRYLQIAAVAGLREAQTR